MGKDLLKRVVDNTGLPEAPVHRELGRLMNRHGITEESVTLESLREMLAEYLQDVICEAKERSKQERSKQA